MNHTPAPWRAVKLKGTKSWSIYANGGKSLGNIRDEGDAHLAAAAPELLAAAKLSESALDGGHLPGNTATGDRAMAAVRAAIAKAEGST